MTDVEQIDSRQECAETCERKTRHRRREFGGKFVQKRPNTPPDTEEGSHEHTARNLNSLLHEPFRGNIAKNVQKLTIRWHLQFRALAIFSALFTAGCASNLTTGAECRTRNAAESCERPALSFSNRDRQSCDFEDVVNIYANGELHHYIEGTSDPEIIKKVDRAVIGELKKATESLMTQGLPFEEVLIAIGGPHYRPKESKDADNHRRRITAYGDFSARLRERVEQLTLLEWRVMPPSSSCVSDSRMYPISQITFYR